MKWIEPELGKMRVRTRFLWLPLTIGRETRWLTKATTEESYIPVQHSDPAYGTYNAWVYNRFLD